MDNGEILTKLEDGYRMPKPANSAAAVYRIMLACWEQLPENRPVQ